MIMLIYKDVGVVQKPIPRVKMCGYSKNFQQVCSTREGLCKKLAPNENPYTDKFAANVHQFYDLHAGILPSG